MNAEQRAGAWDAAPVALLRLDADGTVLDANATFARWVGRPAAELVGTVRLAALLSVGGRIYWETHVAPLLHMQGRVEEVAVELRAPDRRMPVLLTAVVREDDGTVDVALSGAAERSRYEHELLAARTAADRAVGDVHVLQRLASELSEAADVDSVAHAVVDTLALTLGGAGVTLWTVADGVWTPRAGTPGERPERVPVAGDAVRREADGCLVVPLRGRTRLLGVLRVRPSGRPGADPLDPDLLAATGHQAASALDRARLFDQHASVALELQRAMLATNIPADPRFTIASEYRPGVRDLEVGGDWFDAFAVRHGMLAVTVGDVVGRGLHAATTMSQLRSAGRAVTGPDVRPHLVLEHLDHFVEHAGSGFMSTTVHTQLDLRTGDLEFAVAGHLPPLVLRADGSTSYLWGARSTPLGLTGLGARTSAHARLGAGDTLVLYTDGLVERRTRTLPAGLAALALLVGQQVGTGGGPAGRRGLDVARVVDAALPHHGAEDDVCVVALTWHGPDGGGTPA
ncbi:SpoIIE family protein phosphatase [Cellulomonas endometrii]|uniref:SpoIIE family protein phosphatase n=1 Tax=Cellulomonas endometrii TaxID=3036301 RepID=UPI0024AD2B90|nr:SpoIIE family protein phosphatase [Cellulomonas endometrii]